MSNKRNIRKVAVLGSGVMGSRIACHFANTGTEVLLLDIVPKDAVDCKDPAARNKITDDALAFALKSNPSPIYDKRFASRISTPSVAIRTVALRFASAMSASSVARPPRRARPRRASSGNELRK